jgi:hypothetical protein
MCDGDPLIGGWSYIGKDETHGGGWASDLQGLTHDDTYWYLFQQGCILQMRDSPFAATGDRNRMGIGHIKSDTGAVHYFHIGAGVYSNSGGRRALYAPVEHDTFGVGLQIPSLIALVSLDDRYESDGEYRFFKHASGLLSKPGEDGVLTGNHKGPWCAINPLDGLLYTSDFDNVNCLMVYNHNTIEVFDKHRLAKSVSATATAVKNGKKIKFVAKESASDALWAWSESIEVGLHEFVGLFYLYSVKDGIPTAFNLNKVHGGCFSRNGHLLLTSDEDCGIHVFCGLTGRYYGWIEKNHREVEGITIWDRRTYGKGMVHVAYLEDNYLANDDADIKHWDVPAASGIE